MKLCIINTGGTISSVGTPLGPMGAAEFAKASKDILDPVLAERFPDTELCYEVALRFPESTSGTLDSTNLQPTDWVLMAEFILQNYAAYDGFVILHGTDSMDFTGSALPFLLNVFDAQGFGRAVLDKPVIITGSQVPMYYQSPDGSGPLRLNFNTDAFQNMCGAVACARLGIPEVGIYFDGYLFRGNRALKVNASEFRAFDTPNYPPLAEVGIRMTRYPERVLPGPVSGDVSLGSAPARALATAQLAAIRAAVDDFPAMQFNAFPAAYSPGAGSSVIAGLIDAVVAQGIKGLILQSYGEGNFPSGDPNTATDGAICKALKAANAAGVVIVDCTQVIAGTVNDSAYKSGAWLPEAGALSGADMTPMAAFCKAMLLRAAAAHNGWSLGQVKALVMLGLAGEVRNVSRLDSRANDQLKPGQSIMALDGSAVLTNDPIVGPVLTGHDGALLWAPFGSREAGKPGRLVMQNDGNLVLYSADNAPLWASDTGVFGGASSALILSGSARAGDGLRLAVYDYAKGLETACLFVQG